MKSLRQTLSQWILIHDKHQTTTNLDMFSTNRKCYKIEKNQFINNCRPILSSNSSKSMAFSSYLIISSVILFLTAPHFGKQYNIQNHSRQALIQSVLTVRKKN